MNITKRIYVDDKVKIRMAIAIVAIPIAVSFLNAFFVAIPQKNK